MKQNDAAIDAFMATKFEIDAMLERLAAHSENHFDALPDAIRWGHVGTLKRMQAQLREICDEAFLEGEFDQV